MATGTAAKFDLPMASPISGANRFLTGVAEGVEDVVEEMRKLVIPITFSSFLSQFGLYVGSLGTLVPNHGFSINNSNTAEEILGVSAKLQEETKAIALIIKNILPGELAS